MVATKSGFTEFCVEGLHAGQPPVFSDMRRIFSSPSVSPFLNPLRPLCHPPLFIYVLISGS